MSLPRSAASSPGRSPAPMPNTTIASAEERFAASRWAAAAAASSARSSAEYGTGARAPGAARCPPPRRAVHLAGQLVQRRPVGAAGGRRPARAATHAERLNHASSIPLGHSMLGSSKSQNQPCTGLKEASVPGG